MKAFDMTGRRALVTGANGGIGRATARLLAEMGTALALADLEAPEAFADELRSAGHRADAFACNTGERASVEALAAAAGEVDVLVDSAGICPWDDWQDEGWDATFDRVLATNVKGPVFLGRAFLPAMIRRGKGGRMVFIGSVAGRIGGIKASAHYAMSKGGVHSLVRWLAQRGTPHGVLVNAVAPGPVTTRMTESAGLDASRFPLKRFATPEEIAAPIAFLCSPGASYISGAVLDINGAVYFG